MIGVLETGAECSLDEVPVGLFLFGDCLAVMSEYGTIVENGRGVQRDAYLVESGEYFWGGADGDWRVRAALRVRPVTFTPLRS